MTQQEKIEALALLFDEEVSAITPDTKLDNLIYDSVARMSLLALFDARFGKNIGSTELNAFKTIQDILNLMQE